MRIHEFMSRCVCMCYRVERVRGNLVLIVCRGSYGSLYVGAIASLADNYWPVDNSW